MWIGIHLGVGGHDIQALETAITTDLKPMGVNLLILEVDYNFDYQSHPELKEGDPITKKQARELTALCKKNGIRLVPQFQCLGHQSWDKNTGPLLTKYPELDETPKIPLDNPGIYCRSWCPLNPKTNEIVFALMDELIDAFQADALHVGMDEVFLIASDQCPLCKGKNPADLFAKAVNDYHEQLKKKDVGMMMWSDRLLDANVMDYGEWEASKVGTAPAIDKIPKDIVMCDWHYEKRDSYPSVAYFQKKGFRVLPSGWKDPDAVKAFIDDAKKNDSGKMVGYLATTWGEAGPNQLGTWEPLLTALKELK